MFFRERFKIGTINTGLICCRQDLLFEELKNLFSSKKSRVRNELYVRHCYSIVSEFALVFYEDLFSKRLNETHSVFKKNIVKLVIDSRRRFCLFSIMA